MRSPRPGAALRGGTAQAPFVLVVSLVAALYVGVRLWQVQKIVADLHGQMRAARLEYERSRSLSGDYPDLIHYDVRPGPRLESEIFRGSHEYLVEGPPMVDRDGRVFGGVDIIEKGVVRGWACGFASRAAQSSKVVRVLVYIDGGLAAEGFAEKMVARTIASAHDCRAPQGEEPLKIGFSIELPPLALGKHELRVMAVWPDSSARSELDGSPLYFKESDVIPDAEEHLRRKDAIILRRNSQLSELWTSINQRKPWPDQFNNESVARAFGDDGVAKRPLVGFIIESVRYVGGLPGEIKAPDRGVEAEGLGAFDRRAAIRRSWLASSEVARAGGDKVVAARFMIGHSEQGGDPTMRRLADERSQHNDIVLLSIADSTESAALRLLTMLAAAVDSLDASFYFKLSDDVAVNVPGVVTWLADHSTQKNLYAGCMRSGPVVTDPKSKWFEPESWRFGDGAGQGGLINYPRHASRKMFALSRGIVRYLAASKPILHHYKNEDVAVGAWLLGFEVRMVHEQRFCCDSALACTRQMGNNAPCLGFIESSCDGICSPEKRMESAYRSCMVPRTETTA